MDERERARDLTALGLGPDANWADVLRAVNRRRALYSGEHAATYNLCSDDERGDMLAEVEAAFDRLSGSVVASVGRPGTLVVPAVEEKDEVPAGAPPDPSDSPGGHLRHHRLQRGLNLNQVAAEIKVGATYLGSIEAEDFKALPATVYVRGFILSYAGLLGLPEPETLATSFLERMQAQP